MTLTPFHPCKSNSLKSACVNRLEELILSGELKVGRTPAPRKRDLAARFGGSVVPVLHEALVGPGLQGSGDDPSAPRCGDQRLSLSPVRFAILSSLLTYHNGELDPKLVSSMLSMRILVENRKPPNSRHNISPHRKLAELRGIIQSEKIRRSQQPHCADRPGFRVFTS